MERRLMSVEKLSSSMGNHFWSWQEWRMVCWGMPSKVCMWKRRKEKKQKKSLW
uniref:Nuclear autoantigenic sperm protein n=1 Tax=Molossus molossus TaxID=27622 RepID=A0A7J8FAH3_MOLMO|nr:nuclear autoantigenic sperm protein [Molossus molossus]